MRKKYLSALLFGALLFASAGTFTSCKDYDDDIDNLQSQIDKVVSDLASLKSTVDNLNVGVTSVTVDGDQLVVVTNGATTKMNLPVGVQVSEIEIKDGHLIVGGVDKGAIAGETEKAQKVEVKEDGFLYIDDVKQDGLHVGTDVVIKDASNGVYTITIGKETITLPMASANNLYTITVNDATFAVAGANGIAWAKAAGDVDWKGPKGAVAKDQLLIGMQKGIKVTVLPYSYNLAAQDLKLVDSDGKFAPVTLVATKTTGDNPVYDNGPRASLSGTWTVKAIMDNTITADNIATAFTTNVAGTDKNVKYALSVNGVQQTDFNILVDTYTKDQSNDVDATCNTDGDLTIKGIAVSRANRIPVGESTLGFVNKDAYDCYLSFEGTYIAMAREMGVSVDGMNIKVDPKAGLSANALNVTLHVMNVKGKTETRNLPLYFGKSEISSETIATTTYNVMPSASGFATLKVSLGDVLASMSDAHAESVTRAEQLILTVKDGNVTKFITNLAEKYYVKSFNDNGTEIVYDPSTDDVRAIKYITIPVRSIQSGAEKGDYTLVFTILDKVNGNEIKKVEMPVSITLPTFDELFTKSASWDGSTLLLQLNNNKAANYLTAYQLGAGVDSNNLKIATEAKYGIATSPTFSIAAATDAVKDGAVQEFKAKSQYTIGGNYVVESDEYTIKLLSPMNDAAIVNYADDKAADITISGTGATLNAYANKSGLKLEVGGEKVALQKNITVNGVQINNSNVKFSFDNAGATAAAELTDAGISVTNLAPGNYTTNMTVKITDGNNIVTTIVLPIKVN